jgi:hypothetical protein
VEIETPAMQEYTEWPLYDFRNRVISPHFTTLPLTSRPRCGNASLAGCE